MMLKKLRSKIGVAVAATTVAVTPALFLASPAHAAVSGTALCDAYNPSIPIVGVWINSSNDAHDGWATWSRVSGQPWKATYSKSNIAAGETYKVHVGCGGTTASWNQTAYSGWVTGGQNFICHVSNSPAQRVCFS
jgi:hypothetical protein